MPLPFHRPAALALRSQHELRIDWRVDDVGHEVPRLNRRSTAIGSPRCPRMPTGVALTMPATDEAADSGAPSTSQRPAPDRRARSAQRLLARLASGSWTLSKATPISIRAKETARPAPPAPNRRTGLSFAQSAPSDSGRRGGNPIDRYCDPSCGRPCRSPPCSRRRSRSLRATPGREAGSPPP